MTIRQAKENSLVRKPCSQRTERSRLASSLWTGTTTSTSTGMPPESVPRVGPSPGNAGRKLRPLAQQRGEVGFEARVGDRGDLPPHDLDPLVGGQAGHRAEHGQAVVAGRLEHAAAQPAGALDDEAVGR